MIDDVNVDMGVCVWVIYIDIDMGVLCTLVVAVVVEVAVLHVVICFL